MSGVLEIGAPNSAIRHVVWAIHDENAIFCSHDTMASIWVLAAFSAESTRPETRAPETAD